MIIIFFQHFTSIIIIPHLMKVSLHLHNPIRFKDKKVEPFI